MGTEIERRFRVDLACLAPNGEDRMQVPRGTYYKQAYLAEAPSIRVRVAGWADASVTNAPSVSAAHLTIKGPGKITRAEWNILLANQDALDLLAIARYGVVEKIRHDVMVCETAWSLDEFLGVHKGLWLAEVELKSEDAAFDRPPWLGEEVTDDARFNNARLAQTTCRFWDDT